VVTATDGTNTVVIGDSILHPNAAIALTSTQWFEFVFDYLFDVDPSSTGGGSKGQFTSAIGGANAFSVKTTLGGTSPGASMDLELCPLI